MDPHGVLGDPTGTTERHRNLGLTMVAGDALVEDVPERWMLRGWRHSFGDDGRLGACGIS